ncbi:Hypothetical predicted protein, partial [Olea europaea subsp. europaea]
SALKSRFGRKDLLVEYYIRELLKLILKNHSEKQPLPVLYDGLQCHLRNLELLEIWERSMGGRDGSEECPTSKECLDSLLKFLKAQKLALAKAGLGLESPSSAPKRTSPPVQRKQHQVP